MKTLSALWFSLRALFTRAQAGDDIDEELAFHLERETRMHEQSGMSPSEARREAMRTFGGVQRYREECRDVRRVSWLTDLGTDVRFALRLARHHPGFSANVILISALGIAACVTTFSMVSGILLSPLPFPDADRVFGLHLRAGSSISAAIPIDTYLALETGSPVLDAIAAIAPARAIAEVNGEPTVLSLERVTASLFPVFGIRPIIGRPFTTEEVAARAPVVLLGYTQWLSRYRGDRGVVGTVIDLDEQPNTIIGVMPPRFRAHFDEEPDMWVPYLIDRSGGRSVNPLVRLSKGVSQERAEAWLGTVMRLKMSSDTRDDSLSASPALLPITDMIYGDIERPLLILLGAVGLVLVLVAANVATMFLARSAAREGELGVRSALGASAGRQLRQLITESVTLTAIGGAVGLILSQAVIKLIRTLGTRVLPRIQESISIGG